LGQSGESGKEKVRDDESDETEIHCRNRSFTGDALAGGGRLNSLDMRADGMLATGSGVGRVTITDVEFSMLSDFSVGSGDVYVAFIASPVPEPATLGMLTLGGLALVRRRKRGMCK